MNFQLIGGDCIKLNCTIFRDIGELARTVHAICDVRYKEINLQKGQHIFLTRVCENRGISLKQLSIMLKVDKTTTTKATQKLIKNGYIYKEKDTDDKRVYRLFPTDKALSIYKTIIEEENWAITTCMKDFTPEQKTLVHSLINQMKENIESDWCEMKSYNKDIE